MTAPPKLWKHVIAAFLITLVVYIVAFNWIEHRRVRNGPWEVTFQNSNGDLELVINQASEGIRDVRLHFTEVPFGTNQSQTIQFTAGRKVPFALPTGRCIFLDPLFLPGKAVLDIAGHEIQIMPRVLIVDGVEHPWAATQSLSLGEAKVLPSTQGQLPPQP
jgi:hypothetical protein